MNKRLIQSLDLLMWVGKHHNPTIENFVDESMKLGCCRRVNSVPSEIEIGKSRVFLIHREKVYDYGEGTIFGYFIINGIEFIVGPGVNLTEEMISRGVTPVSVETVHNEPERGCGFRLIGALYLVSSDDMVKLRDLADKSDLSGRITLINPLPYLSKRFRGYRYVLGDKILERVPDQDEWFQGINEVKRLRQENRCSFKGCVRVKVDESGLCDVHLKLFMQIQERGTFDSEYDKRLFNHVVSKVGTI